MKKAKYIRALLLGFIAVAFYNCSDVLPQSGSIADMGTLALASDAEDGFYYYYKGERETDTSLNFTWITFFATPLALREYSLS